MQINTQHTSPVRRDTSDLLEVHTIFPTIQGEGPFTGWPCVFVRLYGCNLQCPGCDTDYTSHNEPLDPDSLLRAIIAAGDGRSPAFHCDPLVVITGGEPFRQNLTPLCLMLRANGYKVQIETNGTLAPNTDFPWDEITVICSPKTGRIHPDVLENASAFKYILEAGRVAPKDGLPTCTMSQYEQTTVARPPFDGIRPVYVQALDESDQFKNAANMAAAVNSAMHFGYRLSVQTHKIANVP